MVEEIKDREFNKVKITKIPYGKGYLEFTINPENALKRLTSYYSANNKDRSQDGRDIVSDNDLNFILKEIIPRIKIKVEELNSKMELEYGGSSKLEKNNAIKNEEQKRILIKSLENPIGAEPIEKIIVNKFKQNEKEGDKNKVIKVVFVIDDHSRKFPFKLVLPLIIQHIYDKLKTLTMSVKTNPDKVVKEEFNIDNVKLYFLIASGQHSVPKLHHLKDMFGDLLIIKGANKLKEDNKGVEGYKEGENQNWSSTYSLDIMKSPYIRNAMESNKENKLPRNLGVVPLLFNDQQNSEFINIGRTSFGNEVLINKTYIEADIKVLITDIMLHYFAGFGGDRKSVMPGVAAKQTINFNHKMATLPEVAPGKLDGNPVHEDMLESAKLAGADFVMNIGLSSKGSIIFCESGGLDTAFREAIKVYKEKVIVNIERQADILVLSQGGYPYDINYYQSLKSLHLCRRASKPKSEGGKIIFITECREGIGNSVFETCMHEYKTPEAVMKFIKESFNQGANSAYYHYKFIQNYDIQIKTSMDQAIVEGLFKLKYISDLEGDIEDTIVEVLKEKIKGLIKMRKMRGEQTEKDGNNNGNSAGKVDIIGKSFYIENEDYVFLIYIIKNGSKLLIETREHRTDD